jgi:hypothetical protein
MKGSTALVIIGVDPHKRTHTASVVETGTDKVLATLQIDASLAGYRRLLKWASGFEQRRWAVENARGLGRHLAQWLVAREEVVDDVPSTATARVRELSRGGRRKTMSSTPQRRRAWPRYAVTQTLSWPMISPQSSPCSTSAATTWSPNAPG